MTVTEARELARTVLDGKSRSYVQAARKLAAFVIAVLGTDDLNERQAQTLAWALEGEPAPSLLAGGKLEPSAGSVSQEDAHNAVQALVRAVWLYAGYNVGSRGPIGCLIEAIELLEPRTAAKIRSGDAGDDWSAVQDVADDEPGGETHDDVLTGDDAQRVRQQLSSVASESEITRRRGASRRFAETVTAEPPVQLDIQELIERLQDLGARLLKEECDRVMRPLEQAGAAAVARAKQLLGEGEVPAIDKEAP